MGGSYSNVCVWGGSLFIYPFIHPFIHYYIIIFYYEKNIVNVSQPWDTFYIYFYLIPLIYKGPVYFLYNQATQLLPSQRLLLVQRPELYACRPRWRAHKTLLNIFFPSFFFHGEILLSCSSLILQQLPTRLYTGRDQFRHIPHC